MPPIRVVLGLSLVFSLPHSVTAKRPLLAGDISPDSADISFIWIALWFLNWKKNPNQCSDERVTMVSSMVWSGEGRVFGWNNIAHLSYNFFSGRRTTYSRQTVYRAQYMTSSPLNPNKMRFSYSKDPMIQYDPPTLETSSRLCPSSEFWLCQKIWWSKGFSIFTLCRAQKGSYSFSQSGFYETSVVSSHSIDLFLARLIHR
jgi:hypothetical protein